MKNSPKTVARPLSSTFLLGLVLVFTFCQKSPQVSQAVALDEMKENFKKPPAEVKPWLYWYWINNHISKEGITKDLQAMADVGIGAALIGNIYLPNIAEDGKVPMLSPEWKALTQHAIREGARLGVDIGLFNSPGWSQSGGPWNEESNSMRFLTSSETNVKGGKKISLRLAKPSPDFEDVSLLAFPALKTKEFTPGTFTITADKPIANLANALDNDTATSASLTGMKEVNLTFTSKQDQTVRSLTLLPSKSTFMMHVKVLAEVGGSWKEIKTFAFDRRSAMDQLGFEDYPPVVISLPEVKANKLKLEFSRINTTPVTKEIGLAEIRFSAQAQLEFYVEKQLAKMHQTPLPLNDAYQWATQPEPIGSGQVLAKDYILDISDKLSADGTLTWDAPAGDWTILRTGMTTTGVKNGPAAPNAMGLEVDKINKKALQKHFEGFVGDILKSMPAEDRKAFKYVVADSYETGSQNWTDDFAQKFKTTYGYAPEPYLPVLTGRIVQSVEASNRFLWDLRRLVADQVAYEYVGGLRELCEKNGLQMWLENYGHWGFPSEFLMYGGQANLIGGEFWAEGDLGSIECRAASSAAHIYGKTQVSAESYTAAGKPFLRHPGMLKKRGDWSFTEGINHVVFHVYIQQAYEKAPGVNAWFGTEFNRHNTWFSQATPWIDYQRRSQYMLQKGKYVADIAYFIGEDVPKMTGVMNPKLPAGYSFDYINAEVLKNRVTVKDGRITLPDGLSYRILVLPDVETMRPEVLEKIKDLVAQGAVVMGNPPKKSPSLQSFGTADQKVEALAKELWGSSFSGTQKEATFGQGLVFRYMDLGQALAKLGTEPDFKMTSKEPVLWIHRQMEDKEIYFITNQSDSLISFNASFRVTGLQPEFWDATNGSTRPLPQFSTNGAYTQVPLTLEPAESGFIVFSKKGPQNGRLDPTQNFGLASARQVLDGAWNVHFKNEALKVDKRITMASLADWTTLADQDLKYFAGTATYQTTFTLDNVNFANRQFLDVGRADVIANIKVNGQAVGGLWTAPWRLDVTDYLKKGENTLEIAVTNLWANKLIEDSGKTKAQQQTWTLTETFKKDNPLQPSGLVGPVKLVTFGEAAGRASVK